MGLGVVGIQGGETQPDLLHTAQIASGRKGLANPEQEDGQLQNSPLPGAQAPLGWFVIKLLINACSCPAFQSSTNSVLCPTHAMRTIGDLHTPIRR